MNRLSLFVAAALAASLQAQSPLETTFIGGFVVTNTPTPITGLFDVTVTEPQGITVTSFDINVNTTHGTNGQIGVWITGVGGTHVGNQMNPAAWTQVSTAMKVHDGGRENFVMQTPFYLAPGTYGMALHCIEANPVYTNGTTQVPPLASVYSNNEASIDVTFARFRQSISTDPFGGTALGFSPRQPNIAMYYEIGVRAVDFEATPTVGSSPLAVQFTSFAFSGVPGGIQAYAWDFDNNGTIDDTGPNPMFTYMNCGTYSVSLTIVDNQGSATETKIDYIATDIVTPSFTNTLLGPLTIQFTDTSAGSPTSWSWDLDGDGNPDSTMQNPIFVYPAGCAEVTVSLTVSRACQPPVTLTKPIAVATSLETTFQGGLITVAGAMSSANYFDIDVANPLGITMCAMHVNSGIGVGGPLTVEIYQTEGTYVGKTGDASLWRLVGSATVTSAGGGNRTFVPFSSPVHFASGTYGICMVHIGASPTYTNLGGMTGVYSNSDLTITAGLSQSEPVFAATSGTFSPRIANVALHYSTSQTNSTAGYGYIGSGCPGTLGVPTNTSTTQPVLGGGANIVIDNLPFNLGALVLGVTRFNPPIDLVLIGMPGCPLHTSLDFIGTLLGAGNTATFPFAIPNSAGLIGAQVYTQAGSFDPGLNGFGFSISDAAVLLVGQ